MPTSSRLIELLELLQSRRDWSGSELADRLGVSTRTLRTNVSQLRDLGYPVEATPGVAGGYRLGAGSRMAPLVLDDEEAIAVAVGLRTAASTGIAGIGETALRALAKLEQVLPVKHRGKVGALHSEVEPLQWAGHSGGAVDAGALATLSLACRDGNQARFDYVDREGTPTQRIVEPFKLVPSGRRWYLAAYDVRRDDWRTFRVDRIERVRLGNVHGNVRELPAPDAATYVQQSIRSSRRTWDVSIRFTAPLEEVRRLLGFDLDGLVAVDDTTCRLAAPTDSLEWVAMRTALMGVDFVVESPRELVEVVADLHARLGRTLDG